MKFWGEVDLELLLFFFLNDISMLLWIQNVISMVHIKRLFFG